MNPRLLSIDNNNFRYLEMYIGIFDIRLQYITNFDINRRRHIGVLFDSIEILCGLNNETNIEQSDNISIQDNCKDIYSIEFKNNIKYIGNISNGKLNGFGEIYLGDHLYYTGEFKNNLFHGKGQLNSNFCDKYVGEFFEGDANGTGKVTWCNGNSYEGKIENNLPEGSGVYKLKNGSFYEGNFHLGNRSGFGVYKSIGKNGYLIEIKSHDWKNDILNGNCSIECKETSFYFKGKINSFCFHPFKIYFLPNGLGVLSKENGNELYVGRFKNGLKHEIGNEYSDNGFKKYSGSFYLDKYHGVGKYFDSSGNITYEGEFYFGDRHGKGFISHENGFEISTFKHDKKFGKSTFTDINLKSTISYYHNDKIVSEKYIESANQEMCPICQDNFKKNDLVTNIPKCSHLFHSECLFLWLKNNDQCPMCRDTNLFITEENPCKKRKLSQ